MDCVAGEALRRQILYTFLMELAVTYKRWTNKYRKTQVSDWSNNFAWWQGDGL